jgi:hypothetical protein
MRRAFWFVATAIVVAGSGGADGPGQVGKKPVPRAGDDAKAPPRSPAVANPRRPKAAASPDPRASSLFRSAENLEKAGKNPGAIGLYRDVIIRYPASPEASASAARIMALGGKVPTQAEINPAPPAEKANFTRAPKPRYASQEATRAAVDQALGGMVGDAMSRSAAPSPAGGYQAGGAYSP